MMGRNPVARERAHVLYGWLLEQDGSKPLPRAKDIARLMPMPNDSFSVSHAFSLIARAGKIVTRSGSSSRGYGHRAVRVLETGVILATDKCPEYLLAAVRP